jgi:hypothetical protein
MASLSYGDFRPLRKGESGYSPTARRYVSPSTGEILPVRQFQKRAEGSALNQKAKQAEQKRIEKQKTTPVAPKQKPTLSKSGKSGRKNLGRHITKQYDKEGNVRRTRINSRSTEGLTKGLNQIGDNQGVILHLIDKNGNVIKAVGRGKKHTSSAGDLKKKIVDRIAAGMSMDDAIFDAIDDSFDLYDENGNPANISTMNFTNIIMYAEA